MKSREYWEKRAIALEYYLQEEATATLEEIQRLYGAALENIENEVHEIRKELGKVTGIVTEEELNELLAKAERDKSYTELQDLLELAETDDEKLDIMNRINAQAYGMRISRLDSVGNKILSEFTKVAAQEKVLCRTLFANALQEAYYTNIHNLAEGYNAGVAFDVLPNRAINKALNASWNGDNYSSRIWKHGQEFTDQVQETVVKGLMTGQSRSKIASELMEYTDSTRYVAERLVRTETAHFLGEGQKEAYEAAGIEKYRYLAALSERTCETCAALDSKVFNLDEATEGVNYPPMHPNCRCVTITADAKLSTRLARDPVTGENYKVEGNMTFAQWKENLSDEQRAAINKYVDNSDKHGIIKENEMFRKKNSTHRKISAEGYRVISEAEYHKIIAKPIKQGLKIERGNPYHEERLRNMGKRASAIGNTIFLRSDCTISDVLEEVYHFEQNRIGMNNDKEFELRFLLNEIDAQKYVLGLTEKYNIPVEEVELTKANLKDYKEQLREYYKRRGKYD